MYWACFMTEHCDRTMQLSNTSDQRGKRSLALDYYVLARCSSTKHSTQQSTLTLQYWPNTSYLRGGMNKLYAVMTISAHWFNIFSHIWEGVRRLSPPLVTCLATVTDHQMAGVGNLRVGNKYRPRKHDPCIRIFVNQDRTQIASKPTFRDKRILSKSRDVSRVHSPSFLFIYSLGRQGKKFKIKLIIFATPTTFRNICGPW